MIATVIRVVLIAVLAIGTVFVPQAVVAQTAASMQVQKLAPITDAVAFVDVVDVSASLEKAINAMSAAEVRQLTAGLKPDDLYVRVNFDGAARVTMLMPVREAADVGRITSVLSQNIAAKGAYTSIAAGLTKAREVMENERGRRTAVVVVMTDGVVDVAGDLTEERKQLDAIASWWKAQPWARRIVVGALPGKAGHATAIAKLLGADYVSLEDYAKQSVVTRAISGARAPKETTAPVKTAAAPVEESLPLPWLLLLVPIAGAAIWYFRGTSPRDRERVAAPIKSVSAPAAAKPEMQVSVRVTAGGRMQETVLPVSDLEGGVFTLGAAGTVPVPGLAGRPITIEAAHDTMSISVETGTGVKIDGEDADHLPQPVTVAGSCRLSYRGAAIIVRVHALNVGANAAAPLVLRRI